MNLMTVFFLQAPAAGPAGGGSMMWIMLIAMFVIMYSIFAAAADANSSQASK